MNYNSVSIKETTPLSERDCFYIADRHKTEFLYPIHHHADFELNFVSNANGVKRIVGDSVEVIGDFDLVLIANQNLEHAWKQYICTSKNIREITIQFSPDLFFSDLIDKKQFDSIREMLRKARFGMSFPLSAIMKVYPILDKLTHEQNNFYAVLHFLTILYELSLFNNEALILASSPTANTEDLTENSKVLKVQKFIDENYKQEIRLDELALLAEMTPTAFSRFFRQQTNKTFSDYIIDTRLSHATQYLLNTSISINEICSECGFHNLSNFNRLFKKKKGCSPKEFRGNYKKRKLVI